MFIVNNRKFFFILSAVLIIGSLFSIYTYGFNLGIDFKGGSILEVSYATERPALETTKEKISALDLGAYSLIPTGDLNYTLKARDITPEEKTKVLNALSLPENTAKEERFNSIGPVVGNEMKNKAMVAIVVVMVCIVLFITFAFRKVSVPVASWKYGLATIIALAHDVIIPTGVFVAWIHFYGGEIDLLFISALLAILGYSVHDTIVVFDRVRENLILSKNKSFKEVVGESVVQTMGRSINTSVTTFLSLLALYLFGGAATQDFAFVLLIGIIVGAYSSIFLASPLLVTLERLQKSNK